MMEEEELIKKLREKYIELLFRQYPSLNAEEMASLFLSEKEHIQTRWFSYQLIMKITMGLILNLVHGVKTTEN